MRRQLQCLDRVRGWVGVPIAGCAVALGMISTAAGADGRVAAAEEASRPYPRLVTAETRADRQAIAVLEKPGNVIFRDDFESPDSLKKYFEIRGLKEGNAKLVTGATLARSGKGAIQFTAVARDGRESGAGAAAWLGPDGYDRLHFRRYIRFAADYDQGNLNHVGGGLTAVAGADRWRAMGSAGIRPRGDDHFNSAFEPWRDWGRQPAPGYMFLYTYWMDMKRDPDGNYWGNMLGPAEKERIVLRRDQWYCLEQMIQVNDVGQANGELAAWIDGQLYIHYKGFRWRTSAGVKLKRFGIGVYVHQAKKDNTVWYDDVAISTGYIGPEVGVSLVPEMEQLPGMDISENAQRWSKAEESRFAADVRQATAEWKKLIPEVKRQVTPEQVRALSRWAKTQMEDYKVVPDLSRVDLRSLGTDAKEEWLLLEGTIDTLPTHSPLVTRWLRAYVLYDLRTRTISRMAITIRGQVLE